MLEFRKKNRIKNILYSPVVLTILFIALVFLVKGVWNVHKKARLSKENLARDTIELQKISDRKNNLALSLEYLKTDKGVESEIRSKFRAVKDGEKIAVIIDDQATATSSIIPEKEKSFWYKIFHLFVI